MEHLKSGLYTEVAFDFRLTLVQVGLYMCYRDTKIKSMKKVSELIDCTPQFRQDGDI